MTKAFFSGSAEVKPDKEENNWEEDKTADKNNYLTLKHINEKVGFSAPADKRMQDSDEVEKRGEKKKFIKWSRCLLYWQVHLFQLNLCAKPICDCLQLAGNVSLFYTGHKK